MDCEEIPECEENNSYRPTTGDTDTETGLIPCITCADGEQWNEGDEVCEEICSAEEGLEWNTENQACESICDAG